MIRTRQQASNQLLRAHPFAPTERKSRSQQIFTHYILVIYNAYGKFHVSNLTLPFNTQSESQIATLAHAITLIALINLLTWQYFRNIVTLLKNIFEDKIWNFFLWNIFRLSVL
jgi:fatty acid desaturase